MHAACFSPCLTTWCKAIDLGYFKSWPGLTSKRVRQCIQQSQPATVKGHITQERQNLRSTKTKVNNFIQKSEFGVSKHESFIKIESFSKKDFTYSDQTGRFPIRSFRNHQYVFILYNAASNNIYAQPLKNRTTAEIIAAYTKIQKEINESFKRFLKKTMEIFNMFLLCHIDET